MGTVHRSGFPPKKFRHKIVFSVSDMEWSEDSLIRWAKASCAGPMQYNFITFQGSDKYSMKSIEVTIWFDKKSDAMLFKLSWQLQ